MRLFPSAEEATENHFADVEPGVHVTPELVDTYIVRSALPATSFAPSAEEATQSHEMLFVRGVQFAPPSVEVQT